MKKKLLLLILTVASFGDVFSQAVLFTTAPNGVTTTQVRAPNGLSTYAYLRSVALVLQSELTGISPTNNTITAFGYTLSAGTNVPVTGNYTVYLQNTTDVSYNKGTNWPTIITGMTTVYASTMTVPASAGTTSVSVTLSTPFVYTGGGIYVAVDWYSAGPYASTPATYLAEGSTLVPGCASANSASSAPNTLGTTAFRPNFLFGTNNPYSNEVSVNSIYAYGKVAGMLNSGHTVNAIVKNNGNQALTNVPVTLNSTGANSFSNVQNISSIAAGQTMTVSFASFNPTNPGVNTLSVSVPNDDLNSNNSSTYTQSVTCNEWSLNPPTLTYTSNPIGFNTGSGIVAVSYSTSVASSLSGIRVAISTPTSSIGNSLWGALLNATGSIIATTNTIVVSASELGTQQTFTFATPQNLTASTGYYIGLAQPANTTGYYPLASAASQYVPYMNYVTTTTVGGTPAPLTSNLGYMDIEAVHVAPQISVNSGSICAGNSFTMAPIGANTYSFSGGSNIVSPSSNATYTVTGLGYGGCISSTVSSVIVNSVPTVSVNSGVITSGQSFTMTPSGASTYTFSSGSAVVSPTTSSTYTVIGTSAAGCVSSNTATSVVTVIPACSIADQSINTPVPASICGSGSSTITVANSETGVFYFLRDNTTNSIVDGPISGNSSNISFNTGTINATSSYNVNAIKDYGIALPTSNDIVRYSSPFYAYANQITVESWVYSQGGEQPWAGQSSIAADNMATNVWLWHAGTFYVNNNGNWISLVFPTMPSGWTHVASVADATGMYIYYNGVLVASNTTGITSGIRNNSSSVIDLGHDPRFAVGTTGRNSNTGFDNFRVWNTARTSTEIANNMTNCSLSNPNLVLNSNFYEGSGTSIVSLTGPQGQLINPTTNWVLGSRACPNCEFQLSQISTVTVNPLPVVFSNPGNVHTCGDVPATFGVSSAGTNTYQWYFEYTQLPNDSDLIDGSYTEINFDTDTMTIQQVLTGNYNNYYVYCEVTNQYGCVSYSANDTIWANPLPTVTVNSGVICAGQSFTMVPSGASTYTYSGGSAVVMPSADASYTVTGTDGNGCENTAVSTIAVNALPGLMTMTTNTLLCTGETATLSVMGASTYTWSTTETTTDIVVTPTVQTTYTVDGTDANGCMNTTTITQDVSLCTGIAGLTNNITVNVYPNPNNGLFVIELTTSAKVTVTNALGQVIIAETFEAGKHDVNIQNEATGVYFIKVIENNKQQIIKVIKD